MLASQSAVLFDLDGTLVDTAPDFYRVINLLLQEEGREPVSYDFLRRYVSNGARAMVAAAFATGEEQPGFNDLHQRMLNLYLQHLDEDSRLFDGLDHCLQWLQKTGIPWGIVTNKPERYTLPLLQSLGLAASSGTVICPDHVTQRKPHPEPLFKACTELNREPQQCIYVGDHIRDIESGQRAGMCTIAATYGYLDATENPADWQADHYIDQPTALLPLLQFLYRDSTPFSLQDSN